MCPQQTIKGAGRRHHICFCSDFLFFGPTWFAGCSLQGPPLHYFLGAKQAPILPTDVLVAASIGWASPQGLGAVPLLALLIQQLNGAEPTALPNSPAAVCLLPQVALRPSELCLKNHSSHRNKSNLVQSSKRPTELFLVNFLHLVVINVLLSGFCGVVVFYWERTNCYRLLRKPKTFSL